MMLVEDRDSVSSIADGNISEDDTIAWQYLGALFSAVDRDQG